MKYTILLISLLTAFRCIAQNPVTGVQFKEAALSSVDVLSSHFLLLQAQSHYNKILNNVSVTDHIAPAKLFINNGTSWDGKISRLLINTGIGYGSIKKFGVFAGFQGDYVYARGNKVNKESKLVRCDVVQGVWYFGFSFLGFQLDAGKLFHANEFALDNNQDFAGDTSQITKSGISDFEKDMSVYTLYHKSGIYFSTVFSKIKYDGLDKRILSEYKFNIQPLKKYLPDVYGLPFLDLIGYTPLSTYYNKYKDFYTAAFNADQTTKNKMGYDATLGSDDIKKLGLRSALTLQVYPKASFRKFEVAYNYFRKEKTQVFGARSQFFMKDKTPNFSFDAFATISTKVKNLTFSVSYSYNSPDNVTFVPLPKLHVIGIQIILGKRETAKAVIPYAAAILSENKEK